MTTYKLTSETLTKGPVTRKIMAETYADALELMDQHVDELDGVWKPLDTENMPLELTFDELLSGDYGAIQNYVDRCGRWHILLKSGWFYTGIIGEETGKRCRAMQRLDPHLM